MSTFYGNNSTEGAKISIRTPEFATNQVFESRESLMDWVQDIGRSLGVVIVTKRSNKHPSGFVYRVVLMCDRGGVYMVKNSSKLSGTKKSNCPFELEGRYSKECDYWTLRVMCDEHNHPLVQYMEGHPYAKRLSEDEISLVADLTRKNVAPKDILLILKERNVNNVSTLKTIYNIRQKIRMVEQVGKSPMQVLMGILHSNGYVYEFSTNDSNELENLFFVHPISFDIWRAFPHVVIIDATYKTNIYNMPFVEIVGASTNQTFCIAFAFMAEIPYIFHPYVTHIQNVMSDGNCGFRSIAVCLRYGEDRWLDIRNELLDELKSGYYNYFQVFNTYFNELYNSLSFFASPAPSEYWMSMPETAILIANRFGVIVHCLNIRESMTCFPLWRGPEEFQHHQSLTITHINGNHFVMVQLQGEYPMPHITRLWTYYSTPNATGWQTLYTPRLELYTRLRPCNSEKPFVDLTD